jgi:hypothetical protein
MRLAGQPHPGRSVSWPLDRLVKRELELIADLERQLNREVGADVEPSTVRRCGRAP